MVGKEEPRTDFKVLTLDSSELMQSMWNLD